MRYPAPLIEGRLLRRYKRFLADVEVEGGMLTVHCPNSGSMAGLLREGNPVRISGPHGAHRKLLYTLEQVRIRRPDGKRLWVGVNTGVPNRLAREAAETGRLPGLEAYREVQSEVRLGSHSRLDLRLRGGGLPDCWVEVKNVTLVLDDPASREGVNTGDIAAFPDAVTTRGAKHLRELQGRVRAGERAVMLFIVQRSDAARFAPAAGFDPHYAAELRAAAAGGVRLLAMVARVRRSGITLGDPLPVLLPAAPSS
ncbi:MAG TPA: DNA/RNA nuclease SfsA [Bacteroidetes bacterium]|nr:DNA/RNA nuclease SfsA [Bacteroidota bacterium]